MNFNKTPKNIPFMNAEEKFMYYEDKEVQALSLKYKKDNLEALLLLPRNNMDINNFISNLTSQKYQEIISKRYNYTVKLYMPKFVINFETELKPCFNSLGMIDAFSDNAKFTNISKNLDLYIGKILHKTFIEVDEEGTTAAAVTASVVKVRGCIPNDNVIMNVDHPFLFIIRSNQLPLNHDILFISKVEAL